MSRESRGNPGIHTEGTAHVPSTDVVQPLEKDEISQGLFSCIGDIPPRSSTLSILPHKLAHIMSIRRVLLCNVMGVIETSFKDFIDLILILDANPMLKALLHLIPSDLCSHLAP